MDQAWGFGLDVHDGDTFTLDISSVRKDNAHTYDHVERVRLRSVSAPELRDPGGAAAREKLRREIGGRRIRVDIYGRAFFWRLLAEVDPNHTTGLPLLVFDQLARQEAERLRSGAGPRRTGQHTT